MSVKTLAASAVIFVSMSLTTSFGRKQQPGVQPSLTCSMRIDSFRVFFFYVFINFMANSSEKIIVKLVFVKRLRHPGPAFSRCKTLPTVCNLWAKKNIMICVRVQSALLRSHRPEGNYYTSQYSRDLLAANLTFVTNAIGCGTVLSFLVSLPKLHVMRTCIKYKFLIFGN